MKAMRLTLAMVVMLIADSAKNAEIHRTVRDTPGGAVTDQIEFQVLPDKLNYAPGMLMRVKFIVTNIGETPIYIFRNFDGCSTSDGFVSLEILDSHNHDVRKTGCSVEMFPGPNFEILKWVHDANYWILLRPRDVYGGTAQFELPAKKGTYRLKAQLYPAALTEKHREILSENNMGVLRIPHDAPLVAVMVR